jgi:hypothetical protein
MQMLIAVVRIVNFKATADNGDDPIEVSGSDEQDISGSDETETCRWILPRAKVNHDFPNTVGFDFPQSNPAISFAGAGPTNAKTSGIACGRK